MYRWSVPLSETPGADWIQVFREAPGAPELSPSAVAFSDASLSFASTMMDGPVWLVSIDRWIEIAAFTRGSGETEAAAQYLRPSPARNL